jgi:hypothetical protein
LKFNGYYNSIGGDRKYPAEQMALFIASFATNGVNSKQDSLKVIKKNSTQITIKAGAAVIEGNPYLNTEDETITLDVSTNGYYRVMVRKSISDRMNDAVLIRGSTLPGVTRDGSIYDLSLAQIKIENGSFTVSDERGLKSVCGYMGFAGRDDLQTMWDQFLSEWEAQKTNWKAWFDQQQSVGWRQIYIQDTEPIDPVEGSLWIG